jgi:acetolactate synthase-1/2/3 large subunit
VGYIGTNGNREANIIFANADLIIAVGSRLDVRQTGDPKFFNQNAKLIHVDIDDSVIDYSIQTTLHFHADLGDFFLAAQSLETSRKEKWWHFIDEIKKNFSRDIVATEEIHPNQFLDMLSSQTPAHSVISVDVGQNQQWCAQSWKVKEGQRVLYSGGMGAMGFSLPVSIGAWYANPEAVPIAVSGDGGLQINIQELETVGRNKIPLKLFVLNNSALGMVREFQDLYFNKNYQSTVIGYGNPNFEKLADAYGLKYKKINMSSEVEASIDYVLNESGPVLVEVVLPVTAALTPKVVYGHALDDQYPHLDDSKQKILTALKSKLYS